MNQGRERTLGDTKAAATIGRQKVRKPRKTEDAKVRRTRKPVLTSSTTSRVSGESRYQWEHSWWSRPWKSETWRISNLEGGKSGKKKKCKFFNRLWHGSRTRGIQIDLAQANLHEQRLRSSGEEKEERTQSTPGPLLFCPDWTSEKHAQYPDSGSGGDMARN